MITTPPSPTFSDAMLPSAWRVVERRDETHDTFTIVIEPCDEGLVMRFAPGQFNMLYAFGAGESAISISGDAAHGSRVVHTIRRVGTVTSALERLQRDDQLGVRGPFGTSWPMNDLRGRDLVFIAGGIGLAPLRPAIYHALNHRAEYGRIVVLAGARTPADVLYHRELEQWSAPGGIECRITVDRAEETWRGNVGVVTKLVGKAALDPANAAALVCGPEIMMRYTAAELRRCGVGDERIFITMERNMKCAVALCGHCQLGPEFICRDGPVYRYDKIAFWLAQREV